MARNEEKAQSMLNRYLAGRQEESQGPKQRRPYLATECHDLNEADKWRQQILREIGRKVMEIQNAGLGEHRIRDLNDEINKLMREKTHWERRIVQLGGPDYARSAPKVTDSHGKGVGEAAGRGAGYRYFGAAKNLPGVRELFEKHEPQHMHRTRAELHRHIDGDYYGFRDEDDGVLVAVEAAAEGEMRAAALREWEAQAPVREREAAEAAAAAAMGMAGDGQTAFVAYVPLPEQKEIEARVLEKKKAALMSKYASDSLQKEQEEARKLLKG